LTREGSGSLLLKFAKILGKENVRQGFFGQEINITTYNLCRINMFLHDIDYDKFDIGHGDTLTDPLHWDDEPFEAIVSNPPYSIRWDGDANPLMINDPRFSPAGVLAPKSKADLAFIMHSLAWLATSGTAAIVCFPGVLYRGGAEKKIRKYLIDNNFIDCIIQLPGNLFFGTSIATCIMVLKKSKAENSTLFIDASKECVKVTNGNKLTQKNMDTIIDAYKNRANDDHVSILVPNSDIAEQEYNLSVSNYVELKDTRETIEITVLNAEIEKIVAMAKKYYTELKKQLVERGRKLNIATIFSYSANEAEQEDVFPDEEFDTRGLDKTSRDFLESAIGDYNADFNVNYDTSSDKFQNYYKDLSLRMKRREVDLLVVVNMFLTGFDATTLNTLWVDKNLRQHGLIQAFSRTNRILNSVKTYGNIVCFRNLQKETDEAIALFGDKDAGSIVLLKNYEAYYNGFDENGKHQPGYVELIEDLGQNFPLGQTIIGEQNQKDFIRLFGAILRLKNILTAFDTFTGNEILSNREFQDYQGVYIDLYHELTKDKNAEKEKINEDIVFEIELIRQVEINIDYILMLVAKFHESNCEDKNILVSIDKAINSSLQLRSKKELIENFIHTINASTVVDEDWRKFVIEQKETDLTMLIEEEKLKLEETRKFINNSFRDGSLKTTGTDIDRIMPPVSRFGGGNRAAKKQGVIERLMQFFEKYFGLV